MVTLIYNYIGWLGVKHQVTTITTLQMGFNVLQTIKTAFWMFLDVG